MTKLVFEYYNFFGSSEFLLFLFFCHLVSMMTDISFLFSLISMFLTVFSITSNFQDLRSKNMKFLIVTVFVFGFFVFLSVFPINARTHLLYNLA